MTRLRLKVAGRAGALISLAVLLALLSGCEKDNPAPDDKAQPAAGASDADKKAQPGAKADKAPPTAPAADYDTSLSKTELAREQLLSRLVREMLEKQHLGRKPINNDVSKAAFDRYLERLDPGKLFLLEADAEKLKTHAQSIDEQIKVGRLELAEDGDEILDARLKVVQGIIKEHLKTPLDLTIDEEHETDSEKRGWCKTDDELRERWRKVLKLGIMSRIVRMEEADKARAETGQKPPKDNPTTFEGREKASREKLLKDWEARFVRMEKETHTEQVELFINALTSVFDPHTIYLPPARKENFDISMSGSLEGIGAVLGIKEHFVEIVRIVPGGASWKEGRLEAGDLVLSVAQAGKEPVDVVDMRLQDVVRLIRGPKGTIVTLTVKKPDERIMVIPITRDVVQLDESYAKGAVLRHPSIKGEIGYIDLPSFYGNTRARRGNTPPRRCNEDVRKLLEIFAQRKVAGVILDLRGNGGGLLSAARSMSGLFIKTGPIVQTKAVEGEAEVLKDFDPGISYDGPVIVMVDRFSASASEIVAGALQDYGRAIIVGPEQTHGKGTVQFLTSLDELVSGDPEAQKLGRLGVLKITRQQFFRVNGASTQHRGVVPDIIMPDPAQHVESGERYLDFSIPWSSVEGVKHDKWPAGRGDVQALKQKSEARQAKVGAFKRVRQRIDLLKAQRERTLEPLNMEKWRALRKQEIDALEALKDDPDKTPERFNVEQLNYAGDEAQPERPKATDGTERKTDKDEVKRKDSWKKSLSRDPWVEESVFIIQDMING